MNSLTEKLGYTFEDESYLTEALTHKSAGLPNNERLEFLGDTVLNLVITEELLSKHPKLAEGKLSPIRAELVKGETLAELSQAIGVGDALHLGLGEKKTGGKTRQSILADAFEAIIGAIFLDSNFDTTKSIILKLYATKLKQPINTKDSKTALQEFLQAKKLAPPHYQLIKTVGKPHEQLFYIECYAGEHKAIGHAKTRKGAEQNAAKLILNKLQM